MSSIVDTQLQTIKSSFRSILEIGKSNCDGSTFMVQSILGQMDSALVKASLKERVVEIIETESNETMEASINEALRKHFLPSISQEASPRAIEQQIAAKAKQKQISSSAAVPATQLAQPAKVELKESKTEALVIPPRMYELAKLVGMMPEELHARMEFVTVNGVVLAFMKDTHEDHSQTEFSANLTAAAQSGAINSFQEGQVDPLPEYGPAPFEEDPDLDDLDFLEIFGDDEPLQVGPGLNDLD